jgi:hypothetical protein
MKASWGIMSPKKQGSAEAALAARKPRRLGVTAT